jgi:hypothetical protein
MTIQEFINKNKDKNKYTQLELYDFLKNEQIVNYLINVKKIDFTKNKYELVEISLTNKLYEKSSNILISKYNKNLKILFEWGFERDEGIIDYKIERLSRTLFIKTIKNNKKILHLL